MTFTHSISPFRIASFLLLTALLIWVEVSVMHSAAFSRHPAGLSLAILFDLVFVTLGLFYWLIARPLRLANSRLVLIGLLMVRVALGILPASAFPSAYIWPTLLILAEGAAIIMICLRIRIITQTYRQLRLTTDTETALHDSLIPVFGKRGAGFIIGEGLVLYYTLVGWRLQPDIPTQHQPFTSYKESGQIALQIGLATVALIETIGVHLLLSRWSPTVAFWVTALSVYGMLFFIADMIATVKRPSYLTNTHVVLRLGVRWRANIPRELISNLAFISEKPIKQANQLNGAFLTAPNVLLTFREPVCFTGPYGIQKEVRQFSFFVDNRADFAQAMV